MLLGAQYDENYKRSEPLSPFLSIMKIMGILAPARPAAPPPAHAGARFGSELRCICVSEAEAWTHAREGSPLHISLAWGAPQRYYE